MVDGVDLGSMGWLTVNLPTDPGREVLLQRIGDTTSTAGPETTDMLWQLTKRGSSSWVTVETDDCHATHITSPNGALRSLKNQPNAHTEPIWLSVTPSGTRSASPNPIHE